MTAINMELFLPLIVYFKSCFPILIQSSFQIKDQTIQLISMKEQSITQQNASNGWYY
jgi:hypothetical protein